MLQKRRFVFLLIGGLVLTSACDRNSGGPALEQLDQEEPVTLKVMYYSESSFLSKYGGMFLAKYPNIHIEVAEMNNVFNSAEKYYEILDQLIAEQNPDILLLNPDSYAKLAAEGRLYELDTSIANDKLDIRNFAPPVLQLLRSRGGGKLYGFSPQFGSTALFYNKTLFDQLGVPYPKDQMTWEEVLDTARRFAGSELASGLQTSVSSAPFFLFTEIIKTHGLSPIDSNNRVTVNTPSWNKVLNMAAHATQADFMQPPLPNRSGSMDMASFLKSFPFIAGKTAMVLGGAGLIKDLSQAERLLKDEVPVWDLVTAPIDPQRPDQSNSYMLNEIYSISSTSTHIRQAWELLKYIHSDEVARVISITEPTLVTRIDQIKNPEGRNVQALWKLSYADNISTPVPLKWNNEFWMMARPEIEAALDGSRNVEDALIRIQQQAENMPLE